MACWGIGSRWSAVGMLPVFSSQEPMLWVEVDVYSQSWLEQQPHEWK